MSSALQQPSPQFQLCTWQQAEAELREVRTRVFIEEQQVPESLEWDGEDAQALHLLARNAAGQAIGTARILLHDDVAHIGRMAVLPAWRNQGVGRAILRLALETARVRGAQRAKLNAQSYAVPFYARAGFVVQGDEFLDAGIPHRRMTRSL